MRATGGPEVAVGDVLLSVENVSLSFGGVKAVSDVSFDIRKGEIRAIIGPNGHGVHTAPVDQFTVASPNSAVAIDDSS